MWIKIQFKPIISKCILLKLFVKSVKRVRFNESKEPIGNNAKSELNYCSISPIKQTTGCELVLQRLFIVIIIIIKVFKN